MGDKDYQVTSRVVNFINENQNESDKSVLYLKGNTLDAVPLSATSWFERVQAWFGFGPLSLRNISKFIQKNNVIEKFPELKHAFSSRLIEKYEHYNQNHSTQKIDRVAINQLTNYCKLSFAGVSSSRTDSALILDFAYSNADLGIAYVIDVQQEGTGQIKTHWNSKFTKIRNSYEESFKEQNFVSLREATRWFKKALQPLIDKPNDFDFSWIQKVQIKGEYHLLICQKGTSATFVKHPDGSVHRLNKKDSKAPIFEDLPISRADVIVGMTKGLGDYTSQNKMINDLQQVEKDPELTFHHLVKTFNPFQKDSPVPSASGKPTTKGVYGSGGDDMALFVLR